VYLTNSQLPLALAMQLVNDSSSFEAGSQQEFSIKAENVDTLSSANLRIVGGTSRWPVEWARMSCAVSLYLSICDDGRLEVHRLC
jgi:hypothetical protein